MGELFDSWTRDHTGKQVIWNKPPYYDPDTGALSLALTGEDPRALTDLATHLKRIKEYYLLTWRDAEKIQR